ncbi:Uncharacterized protein EbC_32090 [Erwinia billingiae Eb661]|uniref:Uncharacterized protein n=1 Tax=Erwinia billingiae (strain Eb661) TaxID=634500 RepID=D8MV83_ERWBE|nr:Uncharacterized protein EbC_32090 [Erwinia billingiae Eb661]
MEMGLKVKTITYAIMAHTEQNKSLYLKSSPRLIDIAKRL